jgi:hypothetical protein
MDFFSLRAAKADKKRRGSLSEFSPVFAEKFRAVETSIPPHDARKEDLPLEAAASLRQSMKL